MTQFCRQHLWCEVNPLPFCDTGKKGENTMGSGYLIALCGVLVGVAVASPVAYPPAGPVRGLLREQEDGQVSTTFLGIPYARPPVGDLRFRKPQPHPGWVEIRDATQYGVACTQDVSVMDIIWPKWIVDKYIRPVPTGEDCLVLNVYYPGNFTARDETESLPVMLYIHGGGFAVGNAHGGMNDFQGLATYGNVIVVNIQYRLGVFGFITTADDVAPGNDGMYDQQLALHWVQDNIRAFGGDPGAVTLFGQSAGSLSIVYHMLNPSSNNLYHQAIGQSGAANYFTAVPLDLVASSTETLLQEVGCSKPSNEESFNCLRNVSAYDIMKAVKDLGLPFGLAEDGFFIPNNPIDRVKQGEFNKVPSMWGFTVFESDIFLIPYDPSSLNRGLNETEVRGFLEGIASTFTNSELVYEAIEAFYFPDGDMTDPFVNIDGVARMTGDSFFKAPSGMMLDKITESNFDTYEYYFTHRTSFMNKFEYSPGAHHSDDVFFSEGKVLPSGVFFGNSTEEERTLSRSMMTAWTSFAKTGRPVYLSSDGSSRSWPKFDLDERQYLEFSTNMNDENEKYNLLTDSKYFWNEVLPAIGGERIIPQ